MESDEGYKLLRISEFDGNGFVNTMDCPSVERKSEAFSFLLKKMISSLREQEV